MPNCVFHWDRSSGCLSRPPPWVLCSLLVLLGRVCWPCCLPSCWLQDAGWGAAHGGCVNLPFFLCSSQHDQKSRLLCVPCSPHSFFNPWCSTWEIVCDTFGDCGEKTQLSSLWACSGTPQSFPLGMLALFFGAASHSPHLILKKTDCSPLFFLLRVAEWSIEGRGRESRAPGEEDCTYTPPWRNCLVCRNGFQVSGSMDPLENVWFKVFLKV